MDRLLKVADVLDTVPRFMGKLAAWLVLPLIAVIMFDVVTRKIDFLRIGMSELTWYWLIEPIKLQDMQWHLHGVLLLLAFGYGYLMNTHVRVDIFHEKLTRRNQAKVEFYALTALVIPYLVLVLYFSVIFVKISIEQGEGSESLTGIPMRYIVKSATIIGFGLLISAVLATYFRLWAYIYGSERQRQRAAASLTIFTHEEEASLKEEALEETEATPLSHGKER